MDDPSAASGSLPHVLSVLLLIGRLGDLISTRVVTPRLKLEANPAVGRAGWPLAAVSLLLALAPYFNLQISVALLATSLLVSASNLSRGWAVHALGEVEYQAILLRAARVGRRRVALSFVIASGAFAALAGGVLMWLSGSAIALSYWFGFGIVLFGILFALYGSSFVLRVFEEAQSPVPAP